MANFVEVDAFYEYCAKTYNEFMNDVAESPEHIDMLREKFCILPLVLTLAYITTETEAMIGALGQEVNGLETELSSMDNVEVNYMLHNSAGASQCT